MNHTCPYPIQSTALERLRLLSGPMPEIETATSWPFQDIAVNSEHWQATTRSLLLHNSITEAKFCQGLFPLRTAIKVRNQRFQNSFSRFQCQFSTDCVHVSGAVILLNEVSRVFFPCHVTRHENHCDVSL